MVERKYFHDLFGGEANAGSIAPYVILVNDPLSVPLLSTQLERVTSVADHYEFRVMTGHWQDVPLSICSTGIGGGSASIAMDNLVRLGAQTIIYADAGPSEVDTVGYWTATGAVRQDGASLDYAHAEFPAATATEVLLAVQAAAQSLDIPVGPALFWATAGPLSPEKQSVMQSYRDQAKLSAGSYFTPLVLTPPEASTILTLATIYRLRAGAIYAGLEDLSKLETTLRQIFLLALSSQRFLYLWDRKKEQTGWKLMTPTFQTTK